MHMRYCAFILNLIIKDGLDAIGRRIEKFRNNVNFCTLSHKRVELFEDKTNCQLQLNCFKNLMLNCKTR